MHLVGILFPHTNQFIHISDYHWNYNDLHCHLPAQSRILDYHYEEKYIICFKCNKKHIFILYQTQHNCTVFNIWAYYMCCNHGNFYCVSRISRTSRNDLAEFLIELCQHCTQWFCFAHSRVFLGLVINRQLHRKCRGLLRQLRM